MIVFSDKTSDDVQNWDVALVMKPDQNLFLIMISCALLLFIIGIVIIVLHVDERSEDQRNKPPLPDF